MSTLVLVGEASKKGRPYLKTVLDSAWTVVDFDAAAPERLTAVAAIGMPAGLRWKEQLPALKFLHDESYDTAAYMERLFSDPKVRADLENDKDD